MPPGAYEADEMSLKASAVFAHIYTAGFGRRSSVSLIRALTTRWDAVRGFDCYTPASRGCIALVLVQIRRTGPYGKF